MLVTKDNFLSVLYQEVDKSKDDKFDFVNLKGRRVFYPRLGDSCDALVNPSSVARVSKFQKGDYSIIWGNGNGQKNIEALDFAKRMGAKVVLAEDGFIRSTDVWNSKVDKRFTKGYSVVLDTRGYYFDATRISTLEKWLNDRSVVVSEKDKENARRLIGKIVSNKISRYNHQPTAERQYGTRGRKKILVIDQTVGDFAVSLSLANEKTFAKMLDLAIAENPDCDILVKTHPCVKGDTSGKTRGYFQDIPETGNIIKITDAINPYSLMGICDKVYVVSSTFGMEALLAGKEVHVFGMPFYAGWGLTIDDMRMPRRENCRSIEELFYLFYCRYTHWVDPFLRKEVTIDYVIDKMAALREEYCKVSR